jgi:NitT/TauT family transport system substrate-binding protein
MRRLIELAIVLLLATMAAAQAESVLRVGFCARTVTSAASPFAIANKMGWFANGAFKVDLVPLAGSADCDKYIGTGDLRYTLPSIEPLAALRPQGVKAKVFYTAYQGYTYGIAVPVASPIKSLKDLKGKKIGVASMASGGAVMVKAVVSNLGIADSVSIIAIGEGAQAAALTRNGEVDALGLYDTQYAIIDSVGVKLRIFPNPEMDRFPGNGFTALDDTIAQHRDEAVALAQGYAKGTIFAIANPAAAVRINWEEFPFTKPTGKDDATALADDVKALEARIVNFKLDKAGVKNWGESDLNNYQAYLDFLLKWGQIKQPIKASEIVTNELIPDIDKFDIAAVTAAAKAYK